MVRRLVQHILRWIRQFFFQVRDTKPRQQTSPRRRLPPADSRRKRGHQAEPTAAPQPHGADDAPATPLQTNSHQETPTAPPPLQEQPPAPAPKVVNTSNFHVLLSQHQRPPSDAVKDLNHQLFTPQTPDIPEQSTAPSPQTTSEPFKTSSDIQQTSTTAEHAGIHRDSSLRIPSVTENISKSLLDSPEQTILSPQKIPQTDRNHLTDPVSDEIQPSPVRSISEPPSPQSLPQASTEQPLTTELSPPQPVSPSVEAPPREVISTTTTAKAGIITKQGVIKLLFKLKKNNYHGYIAPHDGSKDIIFHQKYVGDTIFSQLERGMAVEVTAHVTAGKAYADSIRIL